MSALPAEVQEEIELLQEKRWRLSCRQNLVEYATTVPIPGVPLTDNYDDMADGEIPLIDTRPAKHHVLIYKTAQNIIDGNLIDPDGSVCRRGMIMTPPGAAKSTCLDVVAPSWAMGRYGHEIILASCGDRIAKRHGKRARQLCLSTEHQAVFETTIDPDTKAADNWALTNGARYLAASIHGGLMGNRTDGLIWDDLLSGRKAAESQIERDNAWIAYVDDARTRKKPTAWELGIGTRWHEDDPMGRILPEEWAGESGFIKGRDGYWWYVVCLQAQVENEGDPLGRKIGEYLWEEWFNEEGIPERYWAPLKLDSRSWSSLYQQIPTPPEGDYFKQSWVKRYTSLPKNLNYFISGDYAVTKPEDGSSPDYSSIGVWAVDDEGELYFVDGWHGQEEPDQWIEILLDFVAKYEAIAHIAGKGPIRRGTEPFLKIRMRARNIFTELVWYEESYSKEVNANSFRAMMACGMVHWPKQNEEAEWILRHLTGFGTLKVDDPVDMCAMIGRHVARLWGPAKPKDPEQPPIVEPGKIRMAEAIKRRKK